MKKMLIVICIFFLAVSSDDVFADALSEIFGGKKTTTETQAKPAETTVSAPKEETISASDMSDETLKKFAEALQQYKSVHIRMQFPETLNINIRHECGKAE